MLVLFLLQNFALDLHRLTGILPVEMEEQQVQLTNTSPILVPEEENGQPVNTPVPAIARANYCLYARKSSEDDERQALSIESQVREMTFQAQNEGLNVIEIRQESHSAKATGQRPVFNKLLEDVRAGMFQGILSWAPDRLSRNAGDLGTLVDLMDNGYLIQIRTHGQVFTASPNDKFLLMILCSQAKLENDNRGLNVKRGQKTKCENGFRPNMAPLGYLNDRYTGRGMRKVFVDPDRAPLIKEMFEKVAAGGSGRDIYSWLKNETNLRTRKDRLLTLSSIYRMLNNPYYCGTFEYPVSSGIWYKGSYEPIISQELFKAVQLKLAIHPKTRPGAKKFAFSRTFKCATCGSGITAQEKRKKTTQGIHYYIYYGCTKARDLHCPEPCATEKEITEELVKRYDDETMERVQINIIFKERFEIFQKFSVMFTNDQGVERTIHENFVRHVFKEATNEEKRELVSCLGTQLYLENRRLIAFDTPTEEDSVEAQAQPGDQI